MKLLLLTTILHFFLLSCTREPVCDVFIDMREPIEDCYSITKCSSGTVDEDTLKVCLKEKEKRKNKDNK